MFSGYLSRDVTCERVVNHLHYKESSAFDSSESLLSSSAGRGSAAGRNVCEHMPCWVAEREWEAHWFFYRIKTPLCVITGVPDASSESPYTASPSHTHTQARTGHATRMTLREGEGGGGGGSLCQNRVGGLHKRQVVFLASVRLCQHSSSSTL